MCERDVWDLEWWSWGLGMRSVFGCFGSGEGRLGLASSLVVDWAEGGEKYDGIGENTRGKGG